MADRMWAVGDELPVLKKGPIDRAQIARFAAGIGDFNPLHVDEPFAQGLGFPAPVAHGPLLVSFLAQALRKAFGAKNVRALSAEFRAPVMAGEVVSVVGRVSEIREEGHLAVCDLQLLKADSSVAVIGTGRAVLNGA